MSKCCVEYSTVIDVTSNTSDLNLRHCLSEKIICKEREKHIKCAFASDKQREREREREGGRKGEREKERERERTERQRDRETEEIERQKDRNREIGTEKQRDSLLAHIPTTPTSSI